MAQKQSKFSPLILSLIFAAVVFAVDQAIKVWVVELMDLKTLEAINVLPPYLNLRMAWNEGINFGLFSNLGSDTLRYILIAVALIISAAVLWWSRRFQGVWGPLLVGLIVGGALGNTVDRLVYGAVADFLNMSCCGIHNPFSFNVADIAIFVGAVGLALFSDRFERKR